MTNRREIVLDIESYYDSKTFTLRKMDVPSYVCDPRYETIGMAAKEGQATTFWVDALDIPRYLKDLGDPSDITLIGHNLMFDASIFSWRYGWRPGLYVCTLALARMLLAYKLKSLSLASVARYLGLPEKGTTIQRVDGMTRAMIVESGLYWDYAAYSCLDADLSRGIFDWGYPQIPAEETVVADSVLRMATEPQFRLDHQMLAEHLNDVVSKKEEQLAFAMVGGGFNDRSDLMSNDKFAAVLAGLDIDPPKKISLTTGRETWAFAKTDQGMKDLLEHEDPVVQAVVAARLGIKTTLEETRTERLLNIATLNFPTYGVGYLPVPLKVSGAHTHRLSGDWRLNLQNLGRKSKIRKALVCDDGYEIVDADESQIEARLTAAFCGQWDLVEQFQRALDAYSIMATKIFGVAVTKADVPRRFVGKQCVLSGMYGVGPPKFHAAIRHKAWEEGIVMNMTLSEAEEIIYKYRMETSAITEMRKRLDRCIAAMAEPGCDFVLGPVRFLHQKILLPNGLYLYYGNLSYDAGGWTFTYGGRTKRLYGGALLENIIQALAAIIVKGAMLRLRTRMRTITARVAHQCHDSLSYIVNMPDVPVAMNWLAEELIRPVNWLPTLPLACEVKHGLTYGDLHE